MQRITLTDEWKQLGENKTFLVIKTTGVLQLYISDADPTDTSVAFSVNTRIPIAVPSITEMGGNIWVKGDGVLTYATDA